MKGYLERSGQEGLPLTLVDGEIALAGKDRQYEPAENIGQLVSITSPCHYSTFPRLRLETATYQRPAWQNALKALIC